MKLLKIFGIILLLLSGFPGSATAFVQEFDLSSENLITLEVSEDVQEQLQGTLSILPVIETSSVSSNSSGINLLFRSQSKSSKAELYISWSRFIEPGLGISKIIFPFHSFL